MRQLTTSEASNDEIEKYNQRMQFELWFFTEKNSPLEHENPYFSKEMQLAWRSWQAALKSKQEKA